MQETIESIKAKIAEIEKQIDSFEASQIAASEKIGEYEEDDNWLDGKLSQLLGLRMRLSRQQQGDENASRK